MKLLKQNTFLANSFIMFAGSMLVAFLNYAYYPVIARLVSPDQFGEIQVLVSIYLQISIVFTAINVASIRLIADKEANSSNIVRGFNLLIFYSFLLLSILSILFIGQVQMFFKFNDMIPFLVTVFALLLSVPINYWLAYMQGNKDFVGYSYLNVVASGLKLLAAVGLIWIGFGVAGAVGSIVVGQICALVFIRFRKSNLPSLMPFITFAKVKYVEIKPYIPFLLTGAIATLALTFLFICDLFAAKHFLNPYDAGLYSGMSSIARVVYFACAPLAAVLLASVNRGDIAKSRRNLRTSFILTTLVGGGICLVYYIWPHQIIELVIGVQFTQYSSLLWKLATSFFFLSLFSLILFYSISLKRYIEVVLVCLAAYSFLSFAGNVELTPLTIVDSIWVISVSLLAVTIFLSFIRFLKGKVV